MHATFGAQSGPLDLNHGHGGTWVVTAILVLAIPIPVLVTIILNMSPVIMVAFIHQFPHFLFEELLLLHLCLSVCLCVWVGTCSK